MLSFMLFHKNGIVIVLTIPFYVHSEINRLNLNRRQDINNRDVAKCGEIMIALSPAAKLYI